MTTTPTAELEQRLRAFLDPMLQAGGFRLSYQFVASPAGADPDTPELIVDFQGADAPLLLAEDGELLRSFEYLALEALRMESAEQRRIMFDCQNRRQLRLHELRRLADMAAERVVRTGLPYDFGPMPSRDRRTIHLALQGRAGVRSESEGVGRDRHLVVRPEKPAAPAAGGRKEYRRL